MIASEDITKLLNMTKTGVSDSADINWENVKSIIPDMFFPIIPYSWQTLGTKGFGSQDITNITIAVDKNNVPYVFFIENEKGTVMKFDGNSWVNLSSSGSFPSVDNYTSFVLDNAGVPYVGYTSKASDWKPIVKKFVEGRWEEVGSLNLYGASILEPYMAIDKDDAPYIVFSDGRYKYNPTVKKYNKNTDKWTSIGKDGFGTERLSKGKVLKIDNNKTPYIAHTPNNYEITVIKYNSASKNWDNVGVPGFNGSDDLIDFVNLTIAANGTPYVAYTLPNKASAKVMKFNGSAWVPVGKLIQDLNPLDSISLAIDKDNNPYLAYSKDRAVVVSKYNGNTWVPVGISAFQSVGDPLSLTINKDNTPYVGFVDNDMGNKATVITYKKTP